MPARKKRRGVAQRRKHPTTFVLPAPAAISTAPIDPARLLTRAELCALLNVTYSAVWQWMRDGLFPLPVNFGKGDSHRNAARWVYSEVYDAIMKGRRRVPKGGRVPEGSATAVQGRDDKAAS
jgi:predicted DNA-binding transcriptional regulator AlpA